MSARPRMSTRHLMFVFFLGGSLIGCVQDTPDNAPATITPETLSEYRSSLSLPAEPTHVVSILDIRAHLSEPTHIDANHDPDGDEHAGHDHDGDDHANHDHDGDEHADHDHDGDGHADHDAHDHDAHDHAGHSHAEHDHGEYVHRDSVVLVGKVGGAPGAERSSAHFPFEKGKATFVMFDPSFESAQGEGHEHAEDHECPFCQSKAQDAQAIVRFVDKDGNPIPVDARELFKIEENDLVVVKGTACVQAGMLLVDADGLFVRK